MTGLESLTWRKGGGRLVLIGGASGHWATTEGIDRATIAALRRDGPIAFLPTAECENPGYGASFLDRYAALGAPRGCVIPICDAASARDPKNVRALAQASLIYMGGGDTRLLLSTLAGSPALDGLAEAYDAGAVIVGVSAGAIALCAHGVALDPSVGVLEGWSWLPGVIVAPHFTPQRDALLRHALDAHGSSIGLGLPDDLAIAFGPDSEVETWGDGQVAVIGTDR